MTPFEFGQLMANYTTKQAADPRAMMVSEGGPDLKKLRNAYNDSKEDLSFYTSGRFSDPVFSRFNHQVMPNIGGALGSFAGLAMGAPGNSAFNVGKLLGTGAAGLADLNMAAELQPDYEKYVKDRAAYQSAGGKVDPKIKHPLPLARGVSNAINKINLKLPSAAQVSQAMPKLPRRPFVD